MTYYLYFTGVFYNTLRNINPLHRSQLKCIQIVSIAKRPVIKKYRINVIVQAFMHDLSLLEQVQLSWFKFTTSLKEKRKRIFFFFTY